MKTTTKKITGNKLNSHKLNIYFIRHTEPLIAAGTCYGQLDCPLIDGYQAQLAKISAYFKGIKISALYSSPLQRCALLAETLAQHHTKSPVQYEYAFKEIHFGDWEGMKWDDIARDDIDAWNKNRLHFQFPNGETPAIFYQRVLTAWQCLLSEHINNQQSESLIIIAHAGVIRTILAELTAIPLSESFTIKLDKASISHFAFYNNIAESIFTNKSLL